MRNTHCPICETNSHDREVYAMNFRASDLSPEVFSARRLPDRLHYRMVRCGECGVLRSDPILSDGELAALYARSEFTYAAEAEFTRKTYGRYLRQAMRFVRDPGALLEIGCGSGFFLQEALAQGFREAWGVEPSADAIRHAPEALRPRIYEGLYGADTCPAGSFDLVCGFQVLDHAADPVALLAACRKDLRPGGVALFINHDCGALSARVLGELSPIIDVEHTVLFDKRTMQRTFEKCGFQVREVFAVRNSYPLSYWTKLAPLPAPLKTPLLSLLRGSGAGRIPLTMSAGNLGLIATVA